MKTILCYGDSNTWGWNPKEFNRYAFNERWTGVLSKGLGDGFRIIEEGLNGRTTIYDDPVDSYKNGSTYLTPCLASHKPIDLVIIMLGTNDLKKSFSLNASDIAKGMEVLINIGQKSDWGNNCAPEILIVCPPPVKKAKGWFAEMFEDAYEKSLELPGYYKKLAADYNCRFLDAGEHISASDTDGVHLDKQSHAVLGEVIAQEVKEILL